MHDTIIFALGLLSVILLIYNEVKKFRKGNYDPNLLSLKMNTGFKPLDFFVNFIFIFAAISIDSDYLSGLYVLILCTSILVTTNTLKIRYSRLHKTSLKVLELAIFNMIFLLFAVLGGWTAFK
jgi:hypothetical protein